MVMVYFLAFIAVLVTLLISGSQAFHKIKRIEDRQRALRALVRNQSTQIRQAARQTLSFRRALVRLGQEIRTATDDGHNLTREIEITRRRDLVLLVLDEIRLPADRGWIATVSHPAYRERINALATDPFTLIWQEGRRCFVWAIDRDQALHKIAALLPPERGYEITSIAEQNTSA